MYIKYIYDYGMQSKWLIKELLESSLDRQEGSTQVVVRRKIHGSSHVGIDLTLALGT